MQLTHGTRVMIVEDERLFAEHLRDILVGCGYEVTTVAHTAGEAVRIASTEAPHVVLMDIFIEGELDGIDTAQVLRSRFDVPVLFVTGRTDISTLERVRRAGPWGYVKKPVEADALRSALSVALDRHREHRAMLDRERWFSTAVKLLDEGVVATNREGHVLWMNPAGQRILGAHLARGDDAFAIDALSSTLHRVLDEKQIVDRAVAIVLGSRSFLTSGAPVFDHAGRVTGALLILRRVGGEIDTPSPEEVEDGRPSNVSSDQCADLESSIVTLDETDEKVAG